MIYPDPSRPWWIVLKVVSGSENGPLSDSGVHFANGGGLLLSCPHLVMRKARHYDVIILNWSYSKLVFDRSNYFFVRLIKVERKVTIGDNLLIIICKITIKLILTIYALRRLSLAIFHNLNWQIQLSNSWLLFFDQGFPNVVICCQGAGGAGRMHASMVLSSSSAGARLVRARVNLANRGHPMSSEVR